MNTTVTLNPGFFSRRSPADWGFALLALVGMVFAFANYQHAMDVYEKPSWCVPGPRWFGWVGFGGRCAT